MFIVKEPEGEKRVRDGQFRKHFLFSILHLWKSLQVSAEGSDVTVVQAMTHKKIKLHNLFPVSVKVASLLSI